MYHDSLDPRVKRLELPIEPEQAFQNGDEGDQWQTYEVFHQTSRGEQHKHVGIVHAPSPEMAILFAKEQYARRMKCVNIWVVKTADVFQTEYEDSDMFDPATDKSYRESFGYKNTRQLIDKFKKANNITTPNTADEGEHSNKVQKTVTSKSGVKAGIVVGKKN